jgi:hypothetical protein
MIVGYSNGQRRFRLDVIGRTLPGSEIHNVLPIGADGKRLNVFQLPKARVEALVGPSSEMSDA